MKTNLQEGSVKVNQDTSVFQRSLIKVIMDENVSTY